MNDASLVVAAVIGLVLTAGAILRDTRHRVGLLRISRSSLAFVNAYARETAVAAPSRIAASSPPQAASHLGTVGHASVLRKVNSAPR